jgi:hypothetical protein
VKFEGTSDNEDVAMVGRASTILVGRRQVRVGVGVREGPLHVVTLGRDPRRLFIIVIDDHRTSVRKGGTQIGGGRWPL